MRRHRIGMYRSREEGGVCLFSATVMMADKVVGG